ncbi:MAG: thiamine pyrophosphate-dependent dehydrogenase E1 component subunit alpha [Alphaproteobacteria bacterium]|nr:thiamine pyrophosphate-dependent dehydrogenase E1 component subunit alpha [Alphaproteobacteria bacterium]
MQSLYKTLYRIRRTEEEIARAYPTDNIKSPVHLSIGQEAVSVAVCDSLQSEDIAFGTYRGHALYLAKGGNLKEMIAELYGKESGCGRGKAGSMHLIDTNARMYGASAILATTIPLAVGYALALKMRKSPQIVVCFFGEGSTEEGAYHESVNFAVLKKLPILFVCENNEYAIYSHISARMGNTDVSARASSYGMPSAKVTDGNIFSMHEAAKKAISYVRDQKQGPYFLEVYTQRWVDHVGPDEDFHIGYRSKESVDFWKQKDSVSHLKSLLDEEVSHVIEEQVEQEIKEAFLFAEQSNFPKVEELYKHVFA